MLDLGCGPGLTTRMLAGRFPGASVLGLDSSAAFLATAGCGGDERLEFVQHDVTTMPFPGAPAAVIYARFLLAHLTEPQTLIAAWAGELAHGGGLVLEEVEWIHTTDEVFSEYLDLMAGVLRARHTELYIGPMLGRCEVPACTTTHNDVAVLEPTTAQAAGMFSLNFATVRYDPSVVGKYTEAKLNSLGEALEARQNDQTIGSISWGMRQLVIERRRPC